VESVDIVVPMTLVLVTEVVEMDVEVVTPSSEDWELAEDDTGAVFVCSTLKNELTIELMTSPVLAAPLPELVPGLTESVVVVSPAVVVDISVVVAGEEEVGKEGRTNVVVKLAPSEMGIVVEPSAYVEAMRREVRRERDLRGDIFEIWFLKWLRVILKDASVEEGGGARAAWI